MKSSIIHEGQEELEAFVTELFNKANGTDEPLSDIPSAKNPDIQTEFDLDGGVDIVLGRVSQSKQASKVEALKRGENSGYPSESEADLGLCNILAFYCSNISNDEAEAIIDKIYRDSARYRKKWDKKHSSSGQTYGQMTIRKALVWAVTRYNSSYHTTQDEVDAVKKMNLLGITHNDIISSAYKEQKGCAFLFSKAFKNELCYDWTEDAWFQFSDHFWKKDKVGEHIQHCDLMQSFIDTAIAEIDAKKILIDTKRRKTPDDEVLDLKYQKQEIGLNKNRKALFSVKKKLNSLAYRQQIVKFSSHGANSLGITGEEWDSKPWSLAVMNGIVDLKTGILTAGKPEDYIRSACPTIYDSSAKCPNFVKFLLEILDGDKEVAEFVRLIFGAALIGQASFKQYIVIFSGQGRNGKDTLISIIQFVLGLQLAAPIPAEMLLDSKMGKRSSQGPSPDLMKLRGLRIGYCNETNQGQSFNSGTAKQLSGGGIMTARELFCSPVDWEQSHMLIMLTNNKPHAPVDDYAFWKRIKPVHFPLSYVQDPQKPNERKEDQHIAERLKLESVGILNWLVQGCLDYQKNGLVEPAAVKKALLQYLKDVDLLGMFIDECCTVCDTGKVTSKRLYAEYRKWAIEEGLQPVSNQILGKYMKARYKSHHGNKGNSYNGIEITAGE